MGKTVLNKNSHIVEVFFMGNKDFIVVGRKLHPEDFDKLRQKIKEASGSFHERVTAGANALFSEDGWTWMEFSILNMENRKMGGTSL